MLTAYARKTETGVDIFEDAACSVPLYTFPLDHPQCPTEETAAIVALCCVWSLVWVGTMAHDLHLI